jgi:AraC family transcriptional regulator
VSDGARQQDHRQRVLRAAAYIVDNLARPLTAAEVAKVAAMSEFHFHRVFAAIMAETVGEFTQRRRLEVAALMLAYQPERSMSDIALTVGYSSSANFSKAFALYFGCRPSDVRNPAREPASRLGKLMSRYGKDFVPSDLYALPVLAEKAERERRLREIETGMRFEDHDEIPLACLRSPAGYDFAVLSETWRELIARVRQLGLCGEDIDTFGIAHDSPKLTSPELCRYDACVPYDGKTALPAPLFRAAIPSGRYAIFRYAGEVSGVARRVLDIYSVWFLESSIAPDDQFTTIDHYVNDEPEDGRVDMEIWFRVRPKH